jgi:hypothetical protein
MERQVTGFHQDEEGHWVAELECAHNHCRMPSRRRSITVAAALRMPFALAYSQTAAGTDSTSEHRPPESRSGALPVSEAARTFDSRLRTHHKSWSDWVLWNKRSVTGSDVQTVYGGGTT